MDDASEQTPTFSTARRLGIGFHVFVSSAALLAIMVMLNYLGARHRMRSTWAPDNRLSLAPLTKQFLGGLTNEVQATVFFNADEPLYDSVVALLKEFRHETPRLNLRIIDYRNNPVGARQFLSRFKLPPTEENFVMFEANGRSKPVGASELSNYDMSGLIAGRTREVKRTAFKGEMMFTAAIYSVVSGTQPRAYFLQGHQELDVKDARGEQGFGQFAEMLSLNHVAHEGLLLAGTNDVPADCQLLIIPGAGSRLDAHEVDKLDRYLAQGGRMLVFYRDFPSAGEVGLELMLHKWGVATGNDWVRDTRNVVGEVGMLVTNFGPHAITRPLRDMPLLMLLPRSVRKRADMPLKAEAPEVTEILMTSDAGLVHKKFKDGAPTTAPDESGEIPVAVAVEKGALPGVRLERGTTRIVVIGDVLFANNLAINSVANRHFAEKCVNWLLDRSTYLGGIGPKPIQEFKLTMTNSQMWTVRGIFLVMMPGSALALGLLVWWRRQH